jgi:signal peptidase II
VAVLGLDQLTKVLANAHLNPYELVPVAPLLALRLMFNEGAAFSLLAGAGGWQRWFFTLVAVVISVVIVVWLRRLRAEEKWMAAALAMILGGALGNMVDRLLYGHVIDFIFVYYGDWYWPAFNVADSAITVGAGLVLLDHFLHARRKSRAERPERDFRSEDPKP